MIRVTLFCFFNQAKIRIETHQNEVIFNVSGKLKIKLMESGVEQRD